MKIFDMLFANAMMGEGGGGGGGESLPFKTATVTISTEPNEYDSEGKIFINADEDVSYHYHGIFFMNDSTFYYELTGPINGSQTAIVLYTGENVVVSPYYPVTALSGNVVYDPVAYTLTISGDCSITENPDGEW